MREIVQSFEQHYRYRLLFTRDAFDGQAEALRSVLAEAGAGPHRLLPIVDSEVLAAWPDLPMRIRTWAAANSDIVQLAADVLPIPGGEACKQAPDTVTTLHRLIAQHDICRHSFVLGIGGGAALDAIGYAAATAHRGVRLIRMPTTVLAQNDAGIGVKNAVNLDGRKNFAGTFAPPFAVVNDSAFLDSLPARERRAGIAEAVKVALIRDASFFRWLHAERAALARFESEPVGRMIERCAELHLDHIRMSGDAFERGSARPLDFGHWSAHKLEEFSRGALRHGEAVAVGIALDSLYSQRIGGLGERELEAILETLEDLGFDLCPPELARLDVEVALEDFRQHLGGRLCVTLLDGIGLGVEVDHMDAATLRKCVEVLSKRSCATLSAPAT